MATELDGHPSDLGKDVSQAHHVDFATEGSRSPQERTINTFLLLTCTAFGAASLVFGFDDKIISPVAALTAFVSVQEIPT